MRSSKRTGTPSFRASRTNSSIRLPWVPFATTTKSSGRLASSASRTAWMPVRRSMSRAFSLSIESGAKFQNSRANRFYRRQPLCPSSAIHKQNHTIERAISHASCYRDAQRQKKFSAAVGKLGHHGVDDRLQPVGIDEPAIQNLSGERAKNLARAGAAHDFLTRARSKHGARIIVKNQLQKGGEVVAVRGARAEHRRCLSHPTRGRLGF